MKAKAAFNLLIHALLLILLNNMIDDYNVQ